MSQCLNFSIRSAFDNGISLGMLHLHPCDTDRVCKMVKHSEIDPHHQNLLIAFLYFFAANSTMSKLFIWSTSDNGDFLGILDLHSGDIDRVSNTVKHNEIDSQHCNLPIDFRNISLFNSHDIKTFSICRLLTMVFLSEYLIYTLGIYIELVTRSKKAKSIHDIELTNSIPIRFCTQISRHWSFSIWLSSSNGIHVGILYRHSGDIDWVRKTVEDSEIQQQHRILLNVPSWVRWTKFELHRNVRIWRDFMGWRNMNRSRALVEGSRRRRYSWLSCCTVSKGLAKFRSLVDSTLFWFLCWQTDWLFIPTAVPIPISKIRYHLSIMKVTSSCYR